MDVYVIGKLAERVVGAHSVKNGFDVGQLCVGGTRESEKAVVCTLCC